MLILTGPTAAGKNTIGHLLAKQRSRCALVDFDVINAMCVQPHYTPWDGKEGKEQKRVCIQHVCSIAKGFQETGREVIILDVVDNETWEIYCHFLANDHFSIIQLLPTFPELKKRFIQRGRCLTDEQLTNVYQGQCEFKGFNFRIDNTELTSIQSVQLILNHLENKI